MSRALEWTVLHIHYLSVSPLCPCVGGKAICQGKPSTSAVLLYSCRNVFAEGNNPNQCHPLKNNRHRTHTHKHTETHSHALRAHPHTHTHTHIFVLICFTNIHTHTWTKTKMKPPSHTRPLLSWLGCVFSMLQFLSVSIHFPQCTPLTQRLPSCLWGYSRCQE